MKKRVMRILSVLLIAIMATSTLSFGHSGRTDSQGGHRDNKNASGLGYYHYHCGGYPAHLHKNGNCPYTYTPPKKTVKKITAPTVKVSAVNAAYIKVSWGKRTNATKYYVYRATSKTGNYKRIIATKKTYYNDKTVQNNKTYYYKVKAMAKNSKGNSNYSAVKSGKINFKGKVILSQTKADITPQGTITIKVKPTGTTDDVVATYNDERVDVYWSEADENGWLTLDIDSLAETSDDWKYTDITFTFEKHKRLYSKKLRVYLTEAEVIVQDAAIAA